MVLPKIENLMNIAEFIVKEFNGADVSNVIIDIQVDNKTLQKINEDYYYRNNPNKEEKIIKDVKEVTVEINGVTFKYVRSE